MTLNLQHQKKNIWFFVETISFQFNCKRNFQHLSTKNPKVVFFRLSKWLCIGAEDATAAAKCSGYNFRAQALKAPL